MKKFIAACLSILVGAFGYTITETAIDTRVSNLEAECSSLKEVVSDLCEIHNIPATETTTQQTTEIAIPTEKEEIIAYYNTAVNKAVDVKVGFNKVRYVDNDKFNAGVLLKTFGDVIYQFMGIGAENKYTTDVTKGQWESDLPHQYLRRSTLTAADITNATCIANGNTYTITMNVNSGLSKATIDTKYNNSPIDKCGICVGDGDKSYFDHKTAIVIYDAIDDILGSAKIEESYNNAKVVAVIESATGNLVSLTVEYDISVVIDVSGGGDITGTTHILYKEFEY